MNHSMKKCKVNYGRWSWCEGCSCGLTQSARTREARRTTLKILCALDGRPKTKSGFLWSCWMIGLTDEIRQERARAVVYRFLFRIPRALLLYPIESLGPHRPIRIKIWSQEFLALNLLSSAYLVRQRLLWKAKRWVPHALQSEIIWNINVCASLGFHDMTTPHIPAFGWP